MDKTSTITLIWDVIMTKQHCCGVVILVYVISLIEETISNHDGNSNESANVDVSEGPSGIKSTDYQVIGGESHVNDKTHEGKDETSFTTDHENEKTYTMEIENNVSVTENP